jgi:hypothetical protein
MGKISSLPMSTDTMGVFGSCLTARVDVKGRTTLTYGESRTKMFSIQFTESNSSFGIASIQIGDFSESMKVDLSFWSREEYEKQWSEGLCRIAGGADSSCLVTSLCLPKAANFIMWWVLYRLDQVVAVQNEILFTEELNEVFDPSCPYKYIRPRETLTEEGNKISEWQIGFGEIVAAIKR